MMEEEAVLRKKNPSSLDIPPAAAQRIIIFFDLLTLLHLAQASSAKSQMRLDFFSSTISGGAGKFPEADFGRRETANCQSRKYCGRFEKEWREKCPKGF